MMILLVFIFAVKIDINSVHPDAIQTLPEQYQGAYAREAVNYETVPMSIRAWKEFAKLVENGVDRMDAAVVCFGKSYAEDVVDALELQDV